MSNLSQTQTPTRIPGATVDLASQWPEWPLYGLIDDLLPTLERWAGAGHRVALATLVNIVGTSPRPLGSEMAICDTGEVAGYVSGGCVEGAVAGESLVAMTNGKPRLLDYGAGSPVLDVQLTCGGRIGIFVRALADAADYAARLRAARTRREALEVHVDLATGAQHYVTPPGKPGTADSSSIFVKTHLPPIRLLVFGRNPVALAVCQLAPQFGYEVGFYLPYGPAQPPSGLQLAFYDRRPLAQAIADLPLDPWTAVYTLTHHPDDDRNVLVRALPSPAFAVGVLGSRTKIRERLRQLSAAGVDDDATTRLSAPAGLEIGAHSPREIALSILGQIVSLQPRPVCCTPRDYPLLPQVAACAGTPPAARCNL